MTLKWIGAILVIVGCGGIGFYSAALHHLEERTLRKLVSVLDFMSCELQYKLTPLPELCRQASRETSGPLKKLFSELSHELECQIAPDVKTCMRAALDRCGNIPETSGHYIRQLGESMGRFDLQGQVQALESVRISCRSEIEKLEANKEVRLRSYQTLGLCAGAALVILFI